MSYTVPNNLTTKLRNQIELEIESEMPGIKINEFQAIHDKDHDGDSILRFIIIYDEKSPKLSAKHVSTLVRRIRPLLDSKYPNTFPIFRFLTTREYADDTHRSHRNHS